MAFGVVTDVTGRTSALCVLDAPTCAARLVQKLRTMVATIGPVRILLIRPWTEPLAPLRAVLRDAGMSARFARIDIEPALDAALARGGFDVIIFDPKTKDLSLDIVTTRLREHRRMIPIVVLTTLDGLADAIGRALLSQLN